MPNQTIPEVIAESRTVLAGLKGASGGVQGVLNALTAQLDSLESEYKAQGPTATEDQKSKLQGRFDDLLEAIHMVAADGPTDRSSEMYKEFASNARIFGISLWAIVFVILLIVLLLYEAGKLAACGMPPEVTCALPLVAIMGSLGGFLSCIQSFGRYVGNRQFLRSWTLYYLLFPLKGAGLALVVFFLMHTDLGQQELSLFGESTGQSQPQTASSDAVSGKTNDLGTQGRSSSAETNLPTGPRTPAAKPGQAPSGKKPNLVTACLVAALTGMFANQAIEMLASVFSVVFKRVEGRDPYHDNQANQKPGKTR